MKTIRKEALSMLNDKSYKGIKLIYNKTNKLIVSKNISKIAFKYIWALARLLLLLGLSFLILNPIFVKIATAFKDISDYADPTVFYLPKHPTLKYLFTMLDFLKYWPTLIRTLIFTAGNAFLQTIACTMVAYGIARFKYKGRGVVFSLIILTLVVPSQTTLIPLFLQFKNFSIFSLFTLAPSGGVSIINTYWPFLILSATALGSKNGLFIFMLRQYFKNMPKVLEEAAYIDGCNSFKTFYKIMLPNAIPMIITVFLFSFVWVWNDNLYTSFFAPNLKIMATLLDGIGWRISYYLGSTTFDSTGLMDSIYGSVGVLLHIIPIIILYIFAQKHFVQSIERSGIVG